MIWLIGVICVIVAVVFVFHSNAMSMKTRNKDNENKKNTLKYVALGDSISTGTGAEKGYTKRYKDYLEKKNGKAIEYINLGKNGWTSKQLLDAIKTREEFRSNIRNADILSWNIGGNDMLYCLTRAKAGLGGGKDNQNCYRETLESFKNNWTSIIEEIKSLVSPSCKLITMTNYTSFENWDENAQIMRIYGLKANEFIKVESEKEGIYVADAADYMNGLELDHPAENLLFMDRVHPNEDGHIKIFESLKSLNI